MLFHVADMGGTKFSGAVIQRKLLLPILGLSVFSAWLITVTFQLLLVDIAHTFQIQVGTASFVAAVGSISGVAAGIVMSILSVRINHKLLLLAGLAGTSAAGVVCFFAPNFAIVLISNIGIGAGIAIATAMSYSLIGVFYPFEKRGRAVGYIVAATSLAYVVGAPVVGVLDDIGGVRYDLLLPCLFFQMDKIPD